MQQLQANPQMQQMMSSLGEKMMESNPQFLEMMQAMQDPESQEKMKARGKLLNLIAYVDT